MPATPILLMWVTRIDIESKANILAYSRTGSKFFHANIALSASTKSRNEQRASQLVPYRVDMAIFYCRTGTKGNISIDYEFIAFDTDGTTKRAESKSAKITFVADCRDMVSATHPLGHTW